VRQETKPEELLIVRFILNELNETDRAQVEERFFFDDDFFEQVMATEDALFDDYVQGNLAEPMRERFAHFLEANPERLREAWFVRQLADDVTRFDPAVPPATALDQPPIVFWTALAAGSWSSRVKLITLTLILAGGAFVLTWNVILQNKIGQIQVDHQALEKKEEELRQEIAAQSEQNTELSKQLESEQNKANQLEQELEDLKSSVTLRPASDTVSVVLMPDFISRGSGEIKTTRVGPEVRRLRIQIIIDSDKRHSKFAALIKTFAGKTVWSHKVLQTTGISSRKIILQLPATLFPPDDYRMTLKGKIDGEEFEEIGDYLFRIRQ
jgi:hypothetical protein